MSKKEKPAIAVSACLIGQRCRYNGEIKTDNKVLELEKWFRFVPVCPELLGCLTVPREPSEISGDHVVTKSGKDVTDAYRIGAEKTLELIRRENCVAALLKERSPSCGRGLVHNGLFDGGMVPGNGVTVAWLLENGIPVFGESETETIKQYLKGKRI